MCIHTSRIYLTQIYIPNIYMCIDTSQICCTYINVDLYVYTYIPHIDIHPEYTYVYTYIPNMLYIYKCRSICVYIHTSHRYTSRIYICVYIHPEYAQNLHIYIILARCMCVCHTCVYVIYMCVYSGCISMCMHACGFRDVYLCVCMRVGIYIYMLPENVF